MKTLPPRITGPTAVGAESSYSALSPTATAGLRKKTVVTIGRRHLKQ